MHISHPSAEELQNNFKTSFIFDNNDEMNSFSRWLEHMDINYSRAKIPSINDGKIVQTSCIIINDNTNQKIEQNNVVEKTLEQDINEQTINETEVNLTEEAPLEDVPKKKKKKAKEIESSA